MERWSSPRPSHHRAWSNYRDSFLDCNQQAANHEICYDYEWLPVTSELCPVREAGRRSIKGTDASPRSKATNPARR